MPSLRSGQIRHAAPSPATVRLNALQTLIAQDPAPLSEEGGFVRRLAFRLTMRLVRPVIRHQRLVAERIANELVRLHEAQRAARGQAGAQTAVVLAELRRQEQQLVAPSEPVAGDAPSEAEAHVSQDADDPGC